MTRPRRYVVCLSNDGYQASLQVRRIYETVADPEASGRGLVRVVDESGEDYLFPATLFETIELSASLQEKLALMRG